LGGTRLVRLDLPLEEQAGMDPNAASGCSPLSGRRTRKEKTKNRDTMTREEQAREFRKNIAAALSATTKDAPCSWRSIKKFRTGSNRESEEENQPRRYDL
jgi:hypothetical protein